MIESCGICGTYKVLTARVITLDAETTMSSANLSNSLFSTDGKNFTMISQFRDCSFNQLNLEAFLRETNEDETTSNSILEIHINETVASKSIGHIMQRN